MQDRQKCAGLYFICKGDEPKPGRQQYCGHTAKREKRGREMAQLWGGRFTKETDKLVYDFNASISFDKRFYEQDIRGSIAHVTMLAKQGILTEEEKEQIIKGLESIRTDVENGTLKITE